MLALYIPGDLRAHEIRRAVVKLRRIGERFIIVNRLNTAQAVICIRRRIIDEGAVVVIVILSFPREVVRRERVEPDCGAGRIAVGIRHGEHGSIIGIGV